jgi:chemoreceptor-like protein with four helix bundle sensory module
MAQPRSLKDRTLPVGGHEEDHVKNRPRTHDVLWMGAGALALALVLLVVWHFHQDPAQLLASRANRAEVVGRMQVALASAAEAEKSAVLAITDQDSQAFADQARAATTEVERERQEFAKLLATGGTQREKDLLAQFSDAFVALQRIDDEVLRLAVKNTNLKAYDLLFGPAAAALAELDAALSEVAAKHAESPDARQVLLLTSGARIAALRVQVLLAPHIAEESDAKMDVLEAAMTKDETKARKDLDGLAALPRLAGDADLAKAASSFVRYGELKVRILALSRENTNVRSLALSLNQKRKAMILCLDALGALKQAVLEEPIAGVAQGRPQSPR